MNVLATAKFSFGDHVKIISWIIKEPRLYQKDVKTGEVIREIPLPIGDVAGAIAYDLVKERQNGSGIFTVIDTDGVAHMVDLKKVQSFEVTVEEVRKDNGEDVSSKHQLSKL